MATSGTGSSLISRMMWALRAGLQFSGARDLYAVYGYSRNITEQMLYDKYKRQDVASSIIDKPAEALWTTPPQILVNEKALGDGWDRFVADNQLWSKILRADKMLGMEKYVVLFLGLPGKSETPVSSNAKEVSFVHVFGGSCAAVDSFITDPASPLYGHPEYYKLKLQKSVTASETMRVHHTRCVHLTNELLESNILSEPRLVKGYNILDDILKVAGGSAETFWLTANRGMQVDVDKDMELGEADLNALSDEIDEYQHQLRRVLRTRGVKVNTLGSDVADPRGVFEVSISLLASTYKIPQRILMGAEAGQLASEQDRANWAVSIQERRESFAEPYILLPILQKLQKLGIISTIDATKLHFKWEEAFKVSPLERAQTMAQTARAVVNLSRQAALGHPLLTTEECRSVCNFPEKSALPSVEESMEWQLALKQAAKPEESTDPEVDEEEDDKKDGTDSQKQTAKAE